MPCVHSRCSSDSRRVSRGCRLIGSDRRAQHDVTEHRLGCAFVGGRRRRRVEPVERPVGAVHRKRHHVGRAGQIHPLHVQGGHRLGVEQHDRELGERVDLHRVEHEPAELGERGLVDLDAGLVVDLDAIISVAGLALRGCGSGARAASVASNRS